MLLYLGTGNADGVDGDVIVLGPPFVMTEDELQLVTERLGGSIDAAVTRG